MSRFFGIDVSQHNGVIKWDLVKKSDIDFAMIRMGYIAYGERKVDKRAIANLLNSREAGVDVGIYLFSYALSPQEALRESEWVSEWLGNTPLEYPIAYDFEYPEAYKLPLREQAEIIDTFARPLEKKGFYVSVYMPAYAMQKLSDAEPQIMDRYDKWVAHVTTNGPRYNKPYGMWQHSWEGVVGGIGGNVDMNIGYKDYPAIMRANQLNNMKEAPHGPRYIEIS